MAGEKGHLPSHPGRAAPPSQGPTATTDNLTDAIKTMEAFARSAKWPERAMDAWKRVKEAAINKASGDASRAPPTILSGQGSAT
jgi:hypothetical protein